ncbi:MAG TPA: type II toxin-antitoxin system RelE/ParE family toxin [Pedomonas sp.]|uniref:type II toxin-antitoxin system RelE/ParE family toxin n=1 Tax=Pedomonas sp. TaxID=2976421 RepID=UPI002F419BF7
MIEVRQTRVFYDWHRSLRDPVAQKRIAARIDQLVYGLLSDAKPIGEGVSELRLHFGAGYRL